MEEVTRRLDREFGLAQTAQRTPQSPPPLSASPSRGMMPGGSEDEVSPAAERPAKPKDVPAAAAAVQNSSLQPVPAGPRKVTEKPVSFELRATHSPAPHANTAKRRKVNTLPMAPPIAVLPAHLRVRLGVVVSAPAQPPKTYQYNKGVDEEEAVE